MAIFRDSSIYKLGRKGSLKMARGARDEIRALMLDKINPAADRIASRANQASSWGGYEARRGRNVAFVSVRRGGKDSNRGRRLLQLAQGAAE